MKKLLKQIFDVALIVVATLAAFWLLSNRPPGCNCDNKFEISPEELFWLNSFNK